MKARQLWFVGTAEVEIREQEIGYPAADEILVRTQYSGISAGTEMLVYRGQLPGDIALDASIAALKDKGNSYPLMYGYACVGRIEAVGSAVDSKIQGKLIFAFQPHVSHFICRQEHVVLLPDDLPEEAGIFLANMETAVSLLIDAQPKANESVAVIGLGIVGQLVNCLMQDYPVKKVIVTDRIAGRRELATQTSGFKSFDPDAREFLDEIGEEGVELVFELSGNPQALNLAIQICGFAGRIIVGSWYGNKTSELKLGGRFHRNRISIISSQVSTIHPDYSAVWTREKRLKKALESIVSLHPEQFISHRFHITKAVDAYRTLDMEAEQVMQVIFTYED